MLHCVILKSDLQKCKLFLSPGSEPNLTNMFLTKNLSRLDVLGLQDHSVGDQDLVYEEFKEQLLRDPEGWYESGLLWKGNHPPLPNNKPGSLKRLVNLVKKLEKQPRMKSSEIN